MLLGSFQLDTPVFLAPMAGVTDYAFRTVCAQFGASVTVTEMVSSRALVYGDKKSAGLLRKNSGSVCGAQIFGNDPDMMARAAVIAEELSGCDFIDINMGCPMPKVASNGDGCGLMRTPELACRIVEAVCAAVQVPVTVKCRLGWDRGNINVVELAQGVERSGAAMITVHGRTRSQLYSGVADWDTIAKVRHAVKIPVIANGDITGAVTAKRCLNRTGADGLMIGRSSFGDPWVFAEVTAALRGEEVPPRPPLRERVAVALEQLRLAEEDHGEHIACLEARKHFAWYLKGVPHSAYFKNQICSISTMDDIERIAAQIVRELA